MSMEKSVRPARMIVVGNEKGGSGKSTVAMHVAVALMKAGQTVATIDLDSRQRSLTHYVDNRRAWAHASDASSMCHSICVPMLRSAARAKDAPLWPTPSMR